MTVLVVLAALLVAVVCYDVTQRRHAILRNFPLIGHFRYWLESVGPELRQYIVTSNTEERPFSRDQRRWVYASSKLENNYFGFGSGNDMELTPNYLIIKQRTFPLTVPRAGEADYDATYPIPALKTLGGARQRRRAFVPRSGVNVSGMSFGALSGAAVEALNRGAQIAGCLQNTGEGGVSPHHLHGGDLVWQIGTGYFGCRELDGRFSLQRLKDTVAAHPQLKAIEIKLSQGAKPGVGGVLPRQKITPEIAATRHVPIDRDCISPASHTAFHDHDSLLDFVELIASETGLPVGIKSAVGDMTFWDDLAREMARGHRGVDFITIDGGEGGTGAGPLVFADRVAMPFKIGFSRVQGVFAEHGILDRVVFIGSGKLGFPDAALLAFALGCDTINVGRGALLSIGCIQALRCHTYFLSTKDRGSHNIVFGTDRFNDIRFANNRQSGSDYRILGTGSIVRGTGEAAVIYPQLLPGTTVIQWNPIPFLSQGSNFRTISAFVNDSWHANGNVTVNAGLRWDKNDGRNQQGILVAKDSAFSPRLGVVYDSFADGRWSVTESFAQYVPALSNSIGDTSSAGGNAQEQRFTYQGAAINQDATAANLTTTPVAIRQVFDWFFANGGPRLPFTRQPSIPGVSPQIGDNLTSPKVVEYASGLSRQLP
jgi:glutamate synthase domain-containing protein 2